MVLDIRGLVDNRYDQSSIFSGSHYNELDPCKKIADKFVNEAGWTISSVDRSDGETVITLII